MMQVVMIPTGFQSLLRVPDLELSLSQRRLTTMQVYKNSCDSPPAKLEMKVCAEANTADKYL
jgi:hypothetical protein